MTGKWIPESLVQNNLIEKDYGIKPKFATRANPQANSIWERIHQVIANLSRTYDSQNNSLDASRTKKQQEPRPPRRARVTPNKVGLCG